MSVCCKIGSIGIGESIVADENARKQVFGFKSLVAGNGIKLKSTRESIIISQVQTTDQSIIKGEIDGLGFQDAVYLHLLPGSEIKNCNFYGATIISGQGTISNCVFHAYTELSVGTIYYDQNVKFTTDSSLNADVLELKSCSMSKIEHIYCNEIILNDASIISSTLDINSDCLLAQNSVITANNIYAKINRISSTTLTSHLFDCTGKLTLYSDNICTQGKLCKSMNAEIRCVTLDGGNIETSSKFYFEGNMTGSVNLDCSSVMIFVKYVELKDSTWNLKNSESLISAKYFKCDNTRIFISENSSNAEINIDNLSCSNCEYFLNIDSATVKVLIDNALLYSASLLSVSEKAKLPSIVLGGNFETDNDHLFSIKTSNPKVKLLSSILSCAKTPFVTIGHILVQALPSISNRQSTNVSYKPPHHMIYQT